MIGLVLLCKQVVERLRLYETSILDVDLCVEFARGFRYLDDLKTFFELIWNVCSLTTSSLVSIKVVWKLTFRRPLLYRIQPLLRLRQSRQPDSKCRPKRRCNQPDHVWELRLGGPDTRSNLKMLDTFTNWHIGTQQIWPQIRNLPVGTPIKIRIL